MDPNTMSKDEIARRYQTLIEELEKRRQRQVANQLEVINRLQARIAELEKA